MKIDLHGSWVVSFESYCFQLKLFFGMIGLNCTNGLKVKSMTLLFTGIKQGFAKIELRQETSFFLYLKKYRALRP